MTEKIYTLDNGVRRELTPEEYAQRVLDVEAEKIEAVRVQAAALSEYMQEFRDMRRELLNVLTGIAIAEDLLSEFRVLRQMLLDIPESLDVASATNASDAKIAIKTEYSKAVAQAPEQFVLAFKDLQ